jgi:hypothetical protein
MMVFLSAVTPAIAVGNAEVECGCFGPVLPSKIGPSLVIRNLVFLGGSLLLVKLAERDTPAKPTERTRAT